MSIRRSSVIVTAAAIAASAIVASHAGLIGMNSPRRQKHDVLSLARLRRINLVIRPLPRSITASGLTDHHLRARLKSLLTDAGYEITTRDDEKAPVVAVVFNHVLHQEVPGRVVHIAVIETVQRVRVHRLDADLNIPTASIIGVFIADPNDVGSAAEAETMRLARIFARGVTAATRELGAAKEGG